MPNVIFSPESLNGSVQAQPEHSLVGGSQSTERGDILAPHLSCSSPATLSLPESGCFPPSLDTPVQPLSTDLPDSFDDTILKPYVRGAWLKQAEFAISLGFNVIPVSKFGKAPPIPWGEWKSSTSPRVTLEQCEVWDRKLHPLNHEYNAAWIPGGGVNFCLVGIDVDNPSQLGWAIQTFGPTPWMVFSGRVGGGIHLLYQAPVGTVVSSKSGMIGVIPDERKEWTWKDGIQTLAKNWTRTQIDVKSDRAYLVMPGAIHKTGTAYTSSIPLETITTEWCIKNLPQFPLAAYEMALQQHQQEARALTAEKDAANPHKSTRTLSPLEMAYCGGLEEEPFLQWCRDEPDSVNLGLWFCLATLLRALHGDHAGELQFLDISSRSHRFVESEAKYTFRSNQQKVTDPRQSESKYRSLVNKGYTGQVPFGANSPLQFIERKEAEKLIPSAPWEDDQLSLEMHQEGPQQPLVAPKAIDPALTLRHAEEAAKTALADGEAELRERRVAEAGLKRPSRTVLTGEEEWARKAVSLMNGYLPQFRDLYELHKITPSKKLCGTWQTGLDVAGTYTTFRRMCGCLHCHACGPQNLALKQASLVARFEGTPLWVTTLPRDAMNRWRDIMKRQSSDLTWVGIQLQDRWVVLANEEQPTPHDLEDPYELFGRNKESCIHNWLASAVELMALSTLEMVDGDEIELKGKGKLVIRHSRDVSLDPRKIHKSTGDAKPHKLAVNKARNPAEVERGYAEADKCTDLLGRHTQTDNFNRVNRVRTTTISSPAVAAAIVELNNPEKEYETSVMKLRIALAAEAESKRLSFELHKEGAMVDAWLKGD